MSTLEKTINVNLKKIAVSTINFIKKCKPPKKTINVKFISIFHSCQICLTFDVNE